MTTNIVQCLKHKERPSNIIKVKCNDLEGNEVAKYLPVVGASDPHEFLLNIWDVANILKEQYGIIADMKMKFLMQCVGQAFQCQFMKKWKKFALEVNISDTRAVKHDSTNQGKCKLLIKHVNTATLMKGSKELSEDTKHHNMDPNKDIECIFTINK